VADYRHFRKKISAAFSVEDGRAGSSKRLCVLEKLDLRVIALAGPIVVQVNCRPNLSSERVSHITKSTNVIKKYFQMGTRHRNRLG
jgi:hypothetical protein